MTVCKVDDGVEARERERERHMNLGKILRELVT